MKLFFESALPRSGGQLFKNILIQNINLSVQSDSPLHYKFFQFRNEFNKDSMVSTFDSKDLEDRFNAFWNAGMRAWGKEINNNSKVYIDSFRYWIDDIDSIRNTFKTKIVVVVRNILDVANSFDTINKNHTEFLTKFNGHYDYSKSPQLQRVMSNMLDDQIRLPMTGVRKIIDEKLDDMVLFVKYEDLVEKPDDVFKKFYEFIDEPYYQHQYTDILEMSRIDTPFLPYGRHKVVKDKSKFIKEENKLNNECKEFLTSEFNWYQQYFNYK